MAAKTTFGKLFSFAFAGGSGFIVDTTVLYLLLTYTPANWYLARAVSIVCAVVSNYIINRTFTFGSSGPIRQEGARYGFVAALGAGLNFAIYAVLLLLFPTMKIGLPFGLVLTAPFIATAIAVVLVMFFSWFGYSKFVFRK